MATQAPEEATATRGRILVVDDEAPVRRVIRQALEKHGYDVVEGSASPCSVCETPPAAECHDRPRHHDRQRGWLRHTRNREIGEDRFRCGPSAQAQQRTRRCKLLFA